MKNILIGIILGAFFSFLCIQVGLWDQERESKKALNEWLEGYEIEEVQK